MVELSDKWLIPRPPHRTVAAPDRRQDPLPAGIAREDSLRRLISKNGHRHLQDYRTRSGRGLGVTSAEEAGLPLRQPPKSLGMQDMR
jgi:hypothetical protein